MTHQLEKSASKSDHAQLRQKQFKTAADDLPARRFTARLVKSVDELESLAEMWERLIEMAVRPNPFFDPDFLIPAFKHLGNAAVQVLAIQAPRKKWPAGPPVLCALLPVVKRRFYGLPLSCYEIWKHDQCFDTTPLIRSDCGVEVLSFALDFLGEQERVSLLSLDTVAGGGPFQRLLTEVFFRTSRTVFYRDAFNRACFLPAQDAETYIRSEVSKNTRKGTLRLQRKLTQLGQLRTEVTDDHAEFGPWIDAYLNLESSGWKGRNQTAFASDDPQREFFREMATRSLAASKMTILRVLLDDVPIAMLCDLRRGTFGSHFKTTFDETYAEYTPGLIAELQNIGHLHRSGITVMDSCAEPHHSMISRVWSGRIRYQSLVVALRGPISRLAAASLPLLQLASKFARTRSQR